MDPTCHISVPFVKDYKGTDSSQSYQLYHKQKASYHFSQGPPWLTET